ncbi:MAG: diaminopimelate epimerase, partial [Clostridia bacterium]|nr:diaminopimelate epimerase [Clostridia bacterium]
VAVKVPVFSFEKRMDANSYLGPEMKSTGEVLGVGTNLNEAHFKGLTAAGRKLVAPDAFHDVGVFLSVDKYDNLETVSLAKKLDDLGFKLYATSETAEHIAHLGTDVEDLGTDISEKNRDKIFKLMEEGKVSFLVYTGALMDDTVDDYIALSRKALLLNIPCFTSLDTAMATADIIASRFSQQNTELIDINHMRRTKQVLEFSKMQATGDDYIFIENFKGEIECPESLALQMCDRHYGIGADGMVLIEKSEVADAKMRIFNRDGSEGKMAGNSIRSVAKYLYDNGYVFTEDMTVETASGVRAMHLFTRDGRVNYVEVDMGPADLRAASLPTTIEDDIILNKAIMLGGREYNITCCSIGNPHCVVFCDRVDPIDLSVVGPRFEYAEFFPDRINTEFVRVVNDTTLKVRVYERGNGETMACGTGACAAVVAACENGYCRRGDDITVKLPGGDLIVNYTQERVTLSGNTALVFKGMYQY